MMREQGTLLLDALNASGERSFVIYNELQNQIVKRLIGQAYRIVEKDQAQKLSERQLSRLSEELDLYRIQFFDRNGAFSISNKGDSPPSLGSQSFRNLIQPLLQSIQDTLIIGLQQIETADEPQFGVGIRHPAGGAVVVFIEGQRLNTLRREMGPGRLVQEIGRQPGVAYVALQDTLSIILASRSVKQLSRIRSDAFLSASWLDESRAFRFTPFEDREVFEIVGPLHIQDELVGLFRIGLETSHYHEIRRNAWLRLLLLGIVAVVAGFLSFGFLVSQQNNQLINRAYQQFRSQSSEILQNLEDAVIAVTAEGKITVFNRAAEGLLALSQDQVMGRSVHTTEMDCLSILSETLREGRPMHHSEYPCRVVDEDRILSLHTSILFADGQIETAILVITDLTEQKRLEFQVQQQEKLQAMGKLAAAVAHEIRNPINAIGMIAQRFRKEFRPRSEEKEYDGLVHSILEEVNRTNRIVQEFLQFARPKPLSFKLVSSQSFLQEVIQFFESSAQIRQIQFDSNEIEEVQIEIDPEQMKQALLNLLLNAVEACDAGGQIVLSGRISNQSYEIDIQDDGHGIAAEDQKKVFDLYYTTKSSGTGLGLSITLQIIQAHQGTIDLESGRGKGSLFRIQLPIRQDGSDSDKKRNGQ